MRALSTTRSCSSVSVCVSAHFSANGLAESRIVTTTPPGRISSASRLDSVLMLQLEVFLHLPRGQWRASLSCRRSESEKMMKNAAAKIMPLTVATDLVNRFTIAVVSRTRKTESRPNGNLRLADA